MLVTSNLQKYALLILEQDANGKKVPIRMCVLREQKSAMQPIVRLRLLRSKKSDVDLIENQVVDADLPERSRLLRSNEMSSYIATRIPSDRYTREDDSPSYARMDFIALSYVWGSSASMKARRFSKTLSEDLPRIMQDAIDVTNAIGVRYIWVDALCISQDDPEIRAQQIGQMDKIYRSACAVIVAATGNNAENGLQGLTRSKEVLKPTTWLNGEIMTCMPLEEDLPAPASLSTWSTHAWTLQEGVIAQRRIIFTDDEIILDCGSICLRETCFGVFEEDHGYLNELQNSHNNLENTLTLYEKLLYRYLQRDLSYDEDIIDAFQGISNYLAETSGTKCCWTIPRRRFLNGITWFAEKDSERAIRRTTTLRGGLRSLSWAWSAWEFRRIMFQESFGLGQKNDIVSWTEA